jgi:uncharacterized membrane protein YhaH (DUF805 family)
VPNSNFYNSVIDTFKNYSNFSGRASRANYWFFFLFNSLVGAILFFIDRQLGTVNLLSTIFSILVFIPALSIYFRRLHDINYRGLRVLVLLIPIIGPILLIYWAFVKGDEGSNNFGNPPTIKGTTEFDRTFLICLFVLSMLGLLLVA